MDTTKANDAAGAPGLRLRGGRIAGLLLGFVAVAAAGEVGLRIAAPETTANTVSERALDTNHPLHPTHGLYQLDDRIGFRPVPGSARHDVHGARHNEYSLEKDPARERVLFLGDSVVERGTFLEAVRERGGDERFEWWNAGVSAYSTVQEVGYYREHLEAIDADHVVLVFCLNDYEDTPLVTLDADGKMLILNAHRSGLNPWLMQHSHLFRYWVGRTLAAPEMGRYDESLIEYVAEQLAELRALTTARGATLTAIVFPPMRGEEMWPGAVVENHARTLELFAEQGIPCHDILAPLRATLAAGEELAEPPGDLLHPSPGLSARIADALAREGFLGGLE